MPPTVCQRFFQKNFVRPGPGGNGMTQKRGCDIMDREPPRRPHYEKGESGMLFVCYPKCSTCQKARKWLDSRGISYDLRDIRQQNPTREELETWQEASGLPLKKFFNTSGQQYRELGLKDKLPGLGREEQLQLLAGDGMLVKRPILVTGKTVLVGFRQEAWEEALEDRS